MEPRWTGIWGALATRPPSGPNMAHEKSSRSCERSQMKILEANFLFTCVTAQTVQLILPFYGNSRLLVFALLRAVIG